MFQRLYFNDLYRKDTITREYNQRYISKLKNNYRSHPSLVAVPNKLFYNHEIRSSANPGKFVRSRFFICSTNWVDESSQYRRTPCTVKTIVFREIFLLRFQLISSGCRNCHFCRNADFRYFSKISKDVQNGKKTASGESNLATRKLMTVGFGH